MNKKYQDAKRKALFNQSKQKTYEFNGLFKEGKFFENVSTNKNKQGIFHIKNIFDKSNPKLISNILSFLEFKDIFRLRNTNQYFKKLLSNKKILREYALKGLLSQENRLLFYKTFINIAELKNNLINQFSKYEIKDEPYNEILYLAKDLINKDEKFKYIHQQIKKDINRTFYIDKFKEGNGKEMLENILILVAFIRPEIGYCQGMNFIVGALINFIDDEETCFWIFLHFIDNIGLKDLYLQNMPAYLIKLFQLNYFIKEYFPKMHHHLTLYIRYGIYLY